MTTFAHDLMVEGVSPTKSDPFSCISVTKDCNLVNKAATLYVETRILTLLHLSHRVVVVGWKSSFILTMIHPNTLIDKKEKCVLRQVFFPLEWSVSSVPSKKGNNRGPITIFLHTINSERKSFCQATRTGPPFDLQHVSNLRG